VGLALLTAALPGCGSGSETTTAPKSQPAHRAQAKTTTKSDARKRPSSKSYGPQTSCADVDFPAPPLHAATIHVAGTVDCGGAEAFIRRAHEPCLTGFCNLGGFSCRAKTLGTQQLRVDCRSDDSEIVWVWVGYE
jgi:hypothetical protein